MTWRITEVRTGVAFMAPPLAQSSSDRLSAAPEHVKCGKLRFSCVHSSLSCWKCLCESAETDGARYVIRCFDFRLFPVAMVPEQKWIIALEVGG